MDRIEVKVISECESPAQTMMFLAKLTQRGHKVTTMADLERLYEGSANVRRETVANVARLPHGTIKRFTPITIAIVGASRRFLAQARTNQVGFNYVSASLQYSDYSDTADFVVPYAILKADAEGAIVDGVPIKEFYLNSCRASMKSYALISAATDNDTAGYAAPQGLRNILIMQGNVQSWSYFVKLRGCNRNTEETQYVALRIWEELLKTQDGEELFAWAGPDCMYGGCREGSFSCRNPIRTKGPSETIAERWPLLRR